MKPAQRSMLATLISLGLWAALGRVVVMATRGSASQPAAAKLSAEAALGKKIFFDAALSGSGKIACSTCHDPRYAYGPPNALAVQPGGRNAASEGFRSVPSLRYTLNHVPVWTHIQATNPVERLTETNEVPAGGYTWDGRFNSLHAQAMFPLFSPVEMANINPASLARALSRSAYAGEFRALYGDRIFANPARAALDASLALERFELEDPSFHPYTSKYDRWLNGAARLTPQELRGKALFDDPKAGNCASCHLDEVGANGAHPIFTDFQFEALGVPRNPEVRANRNSHYYDLGLAGPFRTDAAAKDPANCGLFRTPTLRNTAMRRVYFHNGRFHTLREALEFYVERDTDPGKWYPRAANGRVRKFDDMPAGCRDNVDTTDAPMTNRLGGRPVWDAQQISDVIAFLKTLDDSDVEDQVVADSGVSRAH